MPEQAHLQSPTKAGLRSLCASPESRSSQLHRLKSANRVVLTLSPQDTLFFCSYMPPFWRALNTNGIRSDGDEAHHSRVGNGILVLPTQSLSPPTGDDGEPVHEYISVISQRAERN